MNVDRILQTMNEHGVDYLLIGGLNFFLRHEPVATLDVDLWIDDTEVNRRRCETALAALDAEWGTTDEQWGFVGELKSGWLDQRGVYCLNSPDGAIDIFRSVRGLATWSDCASRAVRGNLPAGTEYLGLADEDMLKCQLALDDSMRRKDRIESLRKALSSEKPDDH